MTSDSLTQAAAHAQNLAYQAITKRAQTDLFYLAKHILGYDLMTENTHQELCSLTNTLLPNIYRNIAIDNLSKNKPISANNPEVILNIKDNNNNELSITGLSLKPPQQPPHANPIEGDTQNGGGTIVSLSPGAQNIFPAPDFPVPGVPGAAPGAHKILGEAEDFRTEDTLGDEKTSSKNYDQFSPDKNQLLLLMPRGTFKSSVVTIAFTLQMLLVDQDVRILVDSETFSKAKAFLSEIKGHLEGSEKYREIFKFLYGVYPDAKKKSDIWSEHQLNIASRKRARKEPTISCGGVDVTKNGMHYDLIIMDDLHSELNTQSREQIDKVKQHWKLAYSLLDPGCPLIVIGTRWDYNDVYQFILNEHSDEFNIMIRQAYNKDGSLFFPERLTEIELNKIKKKQGSYLFSCQYMNEPVDDETATFKQSYLVTRPWELVKNQPMNWYLMVDPSYDGPYSDYAALVIAGMNYQRDLYVRHVLRKKMTYSMIIDQMFDLYNRFNPERILLETVATQKSIEHELDNEQKRRNTWLPVTLIRSRTKSKEDRIRALAPFYEFGHIFHVKECSQLDELEYELIHFPKGEHDDILDALATVLEVAKPSSSTRKSFDRREKDRELISILTKPRSPITGV